MGPLLERDGHLEAIDGLLADVTAGRGRAVMLEGHAGVGKTRLLAEAGERAAAVGIRPLRARADTLERGFAWSLVVSLLAPAVAALSTGPRRSLLQGAAAPASGLLSPGARPSGGGGADAFALVHALYWVVLGLADAGPLLIGVDDLHWADEPSLGFLAYLMGRLDGLPVGLVLATRAGGPEPVVALGAHPAATVERLTELGPEAVARLVREHVPAADADLCARCDALSGGNPFYLQELLRTLETAHPGGELAHLEGAAPATVRRFVLVRLGRLGADAQALARAVAVLGEDAWIRHAAALAQLSLPAAYAAADRLAAEGILTASDPVSFAHPLTGLTISSDLAPGARAQAHARAARLLAAEGAAPERVAAQLVRAPCAGDADTVDVLSRAAARALAQGAPAEAAAYLERALAEPPVLTRRATLLRELGQAEVAAGTGDPVAHLTEALELSGDARDRAQLWCRVGWAHHRAGRPAAAAGAFACGSRERPAVDDDLAVDLEAGYLAAAALDPALAADAHARARDLGTRSADTASERALLAQSMTLQVYAGVPHHRPLAIAERLLAGGRLIAEESTGTSTVWHVISCLNWCDRYDLARDALDLAAARARDRRAVMAVAMARYLRSWPRLWSGDVPGAVLDAQEAVEVWRGSVQMYLPPAVYWLVIALLEQGDVEAAERAVAVLDDDRFQATGLRAFVLAAQARLATARGEPRTALGAYLACGAFATERMLVVNPALGPWRSEASLAAWAVGEPERAHALATEAVDQARRFGAPRALGEALRAAGQVRGGDEGLALLRESAAVLAPSGAHLEHARSLVALGAAVRRAGRPGAAREHLRDGLAVAEEAGATVLATRARDELRAAGGRARARATEGGPDALSPGERRVTDLALTGATNRQIAQELFVTVKAVEWHLGNTYRKLGVAGRPELAAALAPTSV